jgi:hypothetical protein
LAISLKFQKFFTVGQNNFGNKIPLLYDKSPEPRTVASGVVSDEKYFP